MSILYGNAVVGQSGGPTAAINATLAGVVRGAIKAREGGAIKTLYGMKNGIEGFLKDEEGKPIYCSEQLKKHVEENEFGGTAFDIGTAKLYEQLYYKITEGKPMTVTPEMASEIIKVIAEVHAQNPLSLKF